MKALVERESESLKDAIRGNVHSFEQRSKPDGNEYYTKKQWQQLL